jgi:hypothetical protein
MSEDKNLSRFWLEDESEIIVYRLGRNWLKTELGKGRQLSSKLIDVAMTEEEFLKKSKIPD